MKPFSGAREARERNAADGRQPIPRQPFSGAHESRKRYAVSGRGFRRLRMAGERRSRAGPKRADNLRFSTLLGSSPFPFVPKSAHGTALPFLFVLGTEKRTAVPLPPRRLGLTPTIPFTATLKPLELCYIQLRKTRAICRDNAATMRKT